MLTTKSPYFRYLAACNRPHLDHFKHWIFQSGMLFNSPGKWWGNHGARPEPHAGLDLCSFEEVHGAIKNLDRHTRIPAAFPGKIIKIAPDFLGKSIFIRHEIFDARGRRLYSAYGHTRPRDALKVGAQVAAGEAVGTISNFSNPRLAVLPHLHLTFAWIPRGLDINDLNWDNMGKNSDITLIDPLLVLEIY
jgi:murein DD-endopeptidase MepM/ murein hydrolase activator NlpD